MASTVQRGQAAVTHRSPKVVVRMVRMIRMIMLKVKMIRMIMIRKMMVVMFQEFSHPGIVGRHRVPRVPHGHGGSHSAQ